MASGLALGISGMMNLGGPVFPGQGVVAPPGVWETDTACGFRVENLMVAQPHFRPHRSSGGP